ncbi:MAG: glycosyltransferase family 4 protein, partial [Thermoplasmata archaeon]
VYPGCTPAPTMSTSRDDYVIAATRWDIDRNLGFLLDALSGMEDLSLHLMLVGNWPSGKFLSDVQALIRDTSLRDRVSIVRDPSEDELERLYSRARGFVLPSDAVFGMGALEAAAHGTPIVMTRTSGAWEVFEPGKDGLAYEENNGETLKDALMRLEDVDEVIRLGTSAWEKAQHYSWEAHCRSLLQTLGLRT